MGCAIGHMTRKCCAYVVYGREMWLHGCNSHDKKFFAVHRCTVCLSFIASMQGRNIAETVNIQTALPEVIYTSEISPHPRGLMQIL